MTPTDTEVEQALAGLTDAMRDTMLGHMVEVTPDESDLLITMGLKEKPYSYTETVKRTVWPVTSLGLAVRTRLKASGMEAHRAETEGLGPEGMRARSEGCAPTTPTQSGDA
jgi:hypothetical protein